METHRILVVDDEVKMRRVLEMVSQIAKTDSTVYIQGESGTGGVALG